MSGVFDLKKGAFDSSEAKRLHRAFDIAAQGLRATHVVDAVVTQRLAHSIIKVARTEADCLNNDGTIDPVRLAQRAVLRMLQLNAPAADQPDPVANETSSPARPNRRTEPGGRREAAGKIMLKLFERTSFAKL